MASRAKTLIHAEWVPTSHATKPAVFPPHPALQSGGWYHATTVEAPGPGRPPVVTHAEKSARVAVGLTLLFGPLGLCYLSAGVGLAATLVTAVVVGYVGVPMLLLLWPLCVAVAARGVRRRRAGVPPHQVGNRRTASR
jgi:hypothetical protein